MKNQMGKHYWKDALLFSLLGCFSFFFIAFYTDIPLRYQDNLLTLQTFIAVIISFSGVGLGMRYVNVKLREMFPTFLKNRRVVFFFFLLAAVFLFFLNYFLLVAAKILIGLPHPFTLAFRGTLLLTLIGLIELMVVSLFMVNEFYKSVIELYRHSKELEETNMQSR